MSMSINSERMHNVQSAEINEEPKGVWNSVKSIFTTLMEKISELADRISEGLARIKNFFTGKKSDKKTEEEREEYSQSDIDDRDNEREEYSTDEYSQLFDEDRSFADSGDEKRSVNDNDPYVVNRAKSQNRPAEVASLRLVEQKPQPQPTEHVIVPNVVNRAKSQDRPEEVDSLRLVEPKPQPQLTEHVIVPIKQSSEEKDLSVKNKHGRSDSEAAGASQTLHGVDKSEKTEQATKKEGAEEYLPPLYHSSLGLVKAEENLSVDDLRARWKPLEKRLEKLQQLLYEMHRNDDVDTILCNNKFSEHPSKDIDDGEEKSPYNDETVIRFVRFTLSNMEESIRGAFAGYDQGIKKEFSDEDRKKYTRELKDMERILYLVDSALEAREGKDMQLAMRFEQLLMADILYSNIHHNNADTRSTNKSEALTKLKVKEHKNHCCNNDTMLLTMSFLDRSIEPSNDERVEKKMGAALFSKCKQVSEMAHMYATGRLTLKQNVSDNPYSEDNIDTRFLRAFNKKYSGWSTRAGYEHRMLATRIVIDTECMNVENSTDINVYRRYVKHLDEAKRMFYEDKDEDRALQYAANILNEVFDITEIQKTTK